MALIRRDALASTLLKKSDSMAATFFGKLFHCRDEVHQYHLQTHSYSEHSATGDFYEKILDHADDIIETYQGTTKQLVNFSVPTSQCPIDIVEYLTEMDDYLREYRSYFQTDIQNKIDELLGDLHKTIYKLTFLK